MKKTLQAAALIILASSAVVAAATSRHSRANNTAADEWQTSYHGQHFNPDSFSIKYSTTNKK